MLGFLVIDFVINQLYTKMALALYFMTFVVRLNGVLKYKLAHNSQNDFEGKVSVKLMSLCSS